MYIKWFLVKASISQFTELAANETQALVLPFDIPNGTLEMEFSSAQQLKLKFRRDIWCIPDSFASFSAAVLILA